MISTMSSTGLLSPVEQINERAARRTVKKEDGKHAEREASRLLDSISASFSDTARMVVSRPGSRCERSKARTPSRKRHHWRKDASFQLSHPRYNRSRRAHPRAWSASRDSYRNDSLGTFSSQSEPCRQYLIKSTTVMFTVVPANDSGWLNYRCAEEAQQRFVRKCRQALNEVLSKYSRLTRSAVTFSPNGHAYVQFANRVSAKRVVNHQDHVSGTFIEKLAREAPDAHRYRLEVIINPLSIKFFR